MDSISLKLTKYLINKGTIPDDQGKIYEFGIERLLSFILNLATVSVIGFIFNNLFYMLLFTVFYMALQRYAGGFHAATKLKCYMYSSGMVIFVSILLTYLSFSYMVLITMLVSSAIMVLFLGPVDNKTKPIDETEQIVYTKRMRITLLIQVLLISGVLLLNYTEVAEYLILAIVFETFMVILGYVKNKMIEY